MNHIYVSVLWNAEFGDCTNNGLSNRVRSGILFWNCTKKEAIEWCRENHKNEDRQFFLVERELWGEDHSYAEPLIAPPNKQNMFGGNFLYTSNDNVYKLDGKKTNSPIPIHDRYE